MRAEHGQGQVFPRLRTFRPTCENAGSSPNYRAKIQWFWSEPRSLLSVKTGGGGRDFPTHRERRLVLPGWLRSASDNLTDTNEYRSGVGAHWASPRPSRPHHPRTWKSANTPTPSTIP